MDRAELEKQAGELNIKVDGRWSDDRLQQEIDKALAEPKQEQEKLFPVKLVKNYRPIGRFQVKTEDGYRDPTAEEELKVKADTAIALTVDEARAVVSKKIAERADEIG